MNPLLQALDDLATRASRSDCPSIGLHEVARDSMRMVQSGMDARKHIESRVIPSAKRHYPDIACRIVGALGDAGVMAIQ